MTQMLWHVTTPHDGQDAPDGVPEDRTASWTRRHDEYTPQELAGGRS